MDFEKQEKLIEELSMAILENVKNDKECFVDKDILKEVFDLADQLRTELGYYLDHFND